MSLTNYVKQWFARADDDLKSIEALLEKQVSPNTICFHAQQAVEKYLKGYLAFHERHIRKVHDLETLVNLCAETDPGFKNLLEDAMDLNDFYMDTRYPDTGLELSFEQARNASIVAKKFKEFVLGKTNT
jgi:HEPN domain-containing protein